jgi:hypothetical protein
MGKKIVASFKNALLDLILISFFSIIFLTLFILLINNKSSNSIHFGLIIYSVLLSIIFLYIPVLILYVILSYLFFIPIYFYHFLFILAFILYFILMGLKNIFDIEHIFVCLVAFYHLSIIAYKLLKSKCSRSAKAVPS